jgi:hypothetical protein
MTSKTITLIVEDSDRPWPLIYKVDMDVLPTDEEKGIDAAFDHSDELLDKVAEERAYETGDELQDVRDRLTLHAAFEGECKLLLDWRT